MTDHHLAFDEFMSWENWKNISIVVSFFVALVNAGASSAYGSATDFGITMELGLNICIFNSPFWLCKGQRFFLPLYLKLRSTHATKWWEGSWQCPTSDKKTDHLLILIATHTVLFIVFLNVKYGIFPGSEWSVASDCSNYLILTKNLLIHKKVPKFLPFQEGRLFIVPVWNHRMMCNFCLLKVSISQ